MMGGGVRTDFIGVFGIDVIFNGDYAPLGEVFWGYLHEICNFCLLRLVWMV